MNASRLQRLLKELETGGFSHAIFAPGASFYYLSGIRTHQSERLTLLGLNATGEAVLLLPRLEAEGISDPSHYKMITSYGDEEGPSHALSQFITALGLKESQKIAVEPLNMRWFEIQALTAAGVTSFIPAEELVMRLRLTKDQGELDALRRAASIVDVALQQALPHFRVGISETELAAELEYQMRKLGSEGTPFGTIVGSGPRGALPHGMPSDRKVQNGDLVVFDYGAMVDGYAADTTRTLAFGELSERSKEVYEVVREAQATAIQSIRPGVTAEYVDKAARNVIEKAGYGEFFTHRTGHGLGLDVHEFPSIVSGNDLTLVPGMVFTVEPGIYLPDQFGVRIEDDVVVTATGVEVITTFTKELMTI